MKKIFPVLLTASSLACMLLVFSATLKAFVGCAVVAVALLILLCRADAVSLWKRVKPVHVIAAALVALAFALEFHDFSAAKDGALLRFMSKSQAMKLRTPVGAVLGIAAIPALATCFAFFSDIAKKRFMEADAPKEQRLSFAASFLILTLVFAVGISAILRANFRYIDDMGRILRGYRKWNDFSRLLTDALAILFHADRTLCDLSPLSQLLAVAIMALSATIILAIFKGRKRFSPVELAAAIPFCLAPHFLECLSYKFDSPFMALSVLFMALPLVCRRENWRVYGVACMLGTLATCMTYQHTAGLFPVLVIFMTLKLWLDGEKMKNLVRFGATSAIGYGLGLAAFVLIVRVDHHLVYMDTAMPPLKALLPNFFGRIKSIYAAILTDFTPLWLLLIGLVVLRFVLSCVTRSKRNKLAALALTAVALVLTAILCFGFCPVVEFNIHYCRYRIGFDFAVALMAMLPIDRRETYRNAVALALSYVFFTFSLTYGNVLSLQKDYSDFRIQQCAADMSELDAFVRSEEPIQLQIVGDCGYGPNVQKAMETYPILKNLVPMSFWEDLWGRIDLIYGYGYGDIVVYATDDLTALNLPTLKDTFYHTLKGDETHLLVELK